MEIQLPATRRLLLLAASLLLLLAACTQDGTQTPQPGAEESGATPTPTTLPPTGTPSSTPTATNTPTPTSTPTPTPTPTPTAPPARVSGEPRAYLLQTPESRPDAVCGMVDIFDFPVGPPDALSVDRGGTDYGRYRERYNGIHAGEDWSGPNGRSLGSAVHAIGHGRVIYAHPNGWGVDKGTVIVRHVLPDGSRILSFYGHLDPPSVDLRYGECVARGEKIGEIGDPRGRPHLHFEIRNHTPADPGPGYWSVDPTLAGWFPPSLTIWESRYERAPGVLWARPPGSGDAGGVEATGFLSGGILLLLEEGRLQGIGLEDGRQRWRQPDPPTPTPRPDATPDPTRIARAVEAAAPVSAALDETETLIYAVDRNRRIQAFAAGEATGDAPLWEPLWQAEPALRGTPRLYPLPGGGVLVVGQGGIVALDPAGRLQWRQEFEGAPGTAVRVGDRLFLPVSRGEPTLWTAEPSGATPWPNVPPGTPYGTGDSLWLYTREAIYRLDPQAQQAELVLALPAALFGPAAHGEGDALALPDGGLLVAHQDLDDYRLLRLDAGGDLVWERSYRRLGDGEARLASLQGQPILARLEPGSTTLVSLYLIDGESGDLLHFFAGGTRTGYAQGSWLLPAPAGTLLLNIGGGHLLSLDPGAAWEALAPAP